MKFGKSSGQVKCVGQLKQNVLCEAEASMCSKPATKDRKGSIGDPHLAISNPASGRWISLDAYGKRKRNRSASANVWSLPTNA
ncbi:uncharacterized protein MONOS_4745 [Monocercomonoides exilis]|uniref:uncharacterized protein n=1 Tax=Monocercomonoides exilis TaxID=2049356 RepID=UPI0035594546|nr:hypothetical protein MONOS_4745 [Monocercomonoides exilis]|eukprot:MONOS_4745.1-p1 / transcript=MONOS_4745.1 / gene=MONOS_4745 / organism=Monocercomonoides_exilis_PA203 / gene_product=unspecified product / transcript_product=unspecified product / location=Mono_scaffold00130:64411-64659(+) / protein_length=83 / sequence_SO=supercontig / SO=protein_coding / is_pseudo=false